MYIQNLTRPFDVELLEADKCPIVAHAHTYFELVYILDGEGTYHIDGNDYSYAQDDIFLIIPGRGHHTSVRNTTSFLFIRFNDVFVRKESGKETGIEKGLLDKLVYIFESQFNLANAIKPKSKNLIRCLCEVIVEENTSNNDRYTSQLIYTLLATLQQVIAENAGLVLAYDEPGIRKIISFIHEKIREPESLKLPNIAAIAGISKSYLGQYFKKHTGVPIQKYISDSRLEIVEQRLKHSKLRLQEIAYEMGFKDESYLVRLFKKNKGLSPIKYRKHLVGHQVQ